MKAILYRWLPVVAWMGMIFYLSAQPDLPQTDTRWIDLLLSSMAHAFLFGVLAVLWARVLGGRRQGLLLAFVLTLLYALFDELHQTFVPGRHADPWDRLIDGLGAALGLGLWSWWRQRRSEF